MANTKGDHAYGPYTILPPTMEDVRQIAAEYHLELPDDEMEFLHAFVEGQIEVYRRISELPEPKLEVRYPRTPGEPPRPEENPLNAWAWRCSVTGAIDGKLAGKRIAVKDNYCVAGVPMTNGSALLAGYVPDFDATVITRILDAGGEVAGKAACEDHSLGLGFNSVTGRVSNPHNTSHSAGGSSSGSAALVASGAIDIAMGGDQGGSIRIPSSLCGVYGLKPTHGLVPYTGIMGHDHVLDHAGPIGPTVRDVAMLLEVVAGRDGLDPRQPSVVPTENYSERMSRGVRGLRIGILREGFEFPASEAEVDETVRAAASKLAEAGADIRTISVPLHRDAYQIFTPIFIEGIANHVGRELAIGTGWKGYYPTSLLDAYGRARQAFASHLSDLAMGIIVSGHYMQTRYYGRFYAKAMNIARTLEAAYDSALAEVDLMLMPTTPRRSGEHVMNATRQELIASGRGLSPNTCPFDMTGHPAMNVPCGMEGGLPVGMQLVGRHFDDGVVLQAAEAFESLGVYSGLSNPRAAGIR